VQGHCLLDEVAGNLDLRDIEGEIRANAHGNARVRLSILAGADFQINAEGNVQCRIPEDASLRLNLSSRGQLIKIRLPIESKTYQGQSYELTVGSGEAKMSISAGGMIFLSGQAGGWTDADERDFDFGEEFSGISEEFNQQIAQQVEAQIEAQMEAITRQLNEQMANLSTTIGKAGLSEEQTERIIQRARESSERATARAQERMRRAQEKLERKLEAARRRTELKAQAAARRSQSRSKRSWNFEWPSPPPAPAKEPISDEERLMILRMLEQKKITLEEAEQLLAALEGRGG
jgi:hypothetical protein